jgi:hypothetical protein
MMMDQNQVLDVIQRVLVRGNSSNGPIDLENGPTALYLPDAAGGENCHRQILLHQEGERLIAALDDGTTYEFAAKDVLGHNETP